MPAAMLSRASSFLIDGPEGIFPENARRNFIAQFAAFEFGEAVFQDRANIDSIIDPTASNRYNPIDVIHDKQFATIPQSHLNTVDLLHQIQSVLKRPNR